MEHSNIRRLNETVEIFCHTSQDFPSLNIWKLLDDYSFTAVDTSSYVVTHIRDDYYTTEITTPDENCYLCIEFGGEPIVLRVGEPTIRFVFFTSEPVEYSYKQFLNTGHIVDTGDLTSHGNGFYSLEPLFKGTSVIEVIDGAGYKEPFKITTPYPTYVDSLSPCTITHGSIEIEPNVWQLVAIPVEHGYWDTGNHTLVHETETRAKIHNYVVTQLEDKYNKPASDLVEVINTYVGDNNFF